ncbi:redox-sensitive transcriptional activator SoxR [Nocardia farcinica]|nr:redox-sensitive transcriptional activator SoxR [Nocardia farcinica]
MKQTPTDLLTVGEVARRAGIATSAVRFYEDQGLIAATRTAGNQRRYPRHVLRRIGIIVAARRFGIPLAEVAEVFADLPHDRMPSKTDWRKISRGWHDRLEARRRELERLEEELIGCIGCGCLSLNTCRVLNPEDRLAAEGPGARRLTSGDADTQRRPDAHDLDRSPGSAFAGDGQGR